MQKPQQKKSLLNKIKKKKKFHLEKRSIKEIASRKILLQKFQYFTSFIPALLQLHFSISHWGTPPYDRLGTCETYPGD